MGYNRETVITLITKLLKIYFTVCSTKAPFAIKYVKRSSTIRSEQLTLAFSPSTTVSSGESSKTMSSKTMSSKTISSKSTARDTDAFGDYWNAV